MIGQQKIKDLFLRWCKDNKIPKVTIINAPQGCGKKEFIKWLSNETQIPYKIFDNKIDDIRNAIKCSQNEFTKQLYVFENLESGSNLKVVQNALLKLLEEPPKNINIFILCYDYNLLLPTIYNRGIKVNFQGYTREELRLFNDNDKLLDIFNNPRDLIYAKNIDIEQLLNLINKIVDKLDLANITNALKLNNYIYSKDNTSGYDINIFTQVLKYVLLNRYYQTLDDKYLNKFNLLQKSLDNLKVNNKYVLDNFLILNYMRNKGWNIQF